MVLIVMLTLNFCDCIAIVDSSWVDCCLYWVILIFFNKMLFLISQTQNMICSVMPVLGNFITDYNCAGKWKCNIWGIEVNLKWLFSCMFLTLPRSIILACWCIDGQACSRMTGILFKSIVTKGFLLNMWWYIIWIQTNFSYHVQNASWL